MLCNALLYLEQSDFELQVNEVKLSNFSDDANRIFLAPRFIFECAFLPPLHSPSPLLTAWPPFSFPSAS